MHTSPFRPGPRYSRSVVVPPRRPTADTAQLVLAAVAGMESIFAQGYSTAKAGVMLSDLQFSSRQQREIGFHKVNAADRSKLMMTVDRVNQRHGRGTVANASAGLGGNRREWTMRQERRTEIHDQLE